MAEFMLRMGKRLVFSRRRRCMRRGVLPLATNALTIAGIVFFLELLLITLGLSDVFLPLSQKTLSYLTNVFF
jgi:hypothetical protein